MTDRTPQQAWRERQRVFLKNANQHRRIASLLRRGTAPNRVEEALRHERMAASIEQHAKDLEPPGVTAVPP